MEQLNNNHSFNLKQREMFAKLLVQAKEHAQVEQESDYSADQRIEEELVPKLAGERGAGEFVEKVRKLRKELEEAKTALSKLGFTCGEDDISLDDDEAPKDLLEAVAEAKRSARKERQQVLKKYDLAILKVWATEDAQEAKKIVEGLL